MPSHERRGWCDSSTCVLHTTGLVGLGGMEHRPYHGDCQTAWGINGSSGQAEHTSWPQESMCLWQLLMGGCLGQAGFKACLLAP